MAVLRFHVACLVCTRTFWLRIQVGYEDRQPFAAPCPLCKTLVRGLFEPKRSPTLTSDHLKIAADGPSDALADYPTMNISVDLPMFIGGVHERGPKTPFLAVYALIDKEEWMKTDYPRLPLDWKEVCAVAEPLVESHFAGNADLFDQQSRRLAKESKVRLGDSKGGVRLMHVMHTAFFAAKNQALFDALDELRQQVPRYFRQSNEAREAFRKEASGALFDECRNKAWRSAQRLVQKQAVMAGAHVTHAIRAQRQNMEELRSVRGDYEELAHIYIQFFEAVSFAVAFHVILSNTVERADPHAMADGSRVSLKVLCRQRAVDREVHVGGKFGVLFAEISRVVRNKLGHHAAHYDFTTGIVTFDNGNKIPLLELQEDLLDIYRLAAWLVEFVALLELLVGGRDVPKEIWREPRMTVDDETIFRQR